MKKEELLQNLVERKVEIERRPEVLLYLGSQPDVVSVVDAVTEAVSRLWPFTTQSLTLYTGIMDEHIKYLQIVVSLKDCTVDVFDMLTGLERLNNYAATLLKYVKGEIIVTVDWKN